MQRFENLSGANAPLVARLLQCILTKKNISTG